jgi:hypothetical protein
MSQEYPWQKPYHDAVLETDNEKLGQLIIYIEHLIDARLSESCEIRPVEYEQMAQTLTGLSILKTDRMSRVS